MIFYLFLGDGSMNSNVNIEGKSIEDKSNSAWLKLALEGANDGYWVWDIINDKVYYDRSFEKLSIMNNSPTHFSYDLIDDIINPLDIDRFKNTLDKYLKKKIKPFKIECRVKTNSMAYEWVLIQGKASWDENDEPIYMAGSYTFLSENTDSVDNYFETQRMLKETSALLNVIFNNIPDPICVKDKEDRIIQCNPAALTFWKQSKSEIVGQKCNNMCEKPCEETATQKSYKYKKPFKMQKYIEHMKKWIDIMSYPVLDDDNNIQYLIEHIRDITDLKRSEMILQKHIGLQERLLEEANEYDKLKTEFFANISHELKTPLNVIIASLQILEKYYTPRDNGVKYTKIMKQNCYRLLRLLNNLIDMTKIDTGFVKLHLENKDIVSFIRQITLSVSHYIENKSIKLIFDGTEDEIIMAFDSEKIDRIMLNLLSNAAKFTPSGGEIRVRVSEEDNHVIISVKDTGVGIPYEKQQLIFERFGQVDSPITRHNKGSGIGLSLVKSLVELHDGVIEFYSEEEKGTEFIIKLPIKITDEKITSEKNKNVIINDEENLYIELSDILD